MASCTCCWHPFLTIRLLQARGRDVKSSSNGDSDILFDYFLIYYLNPIIATVILAVCECPILFSYQFAMSKLLWTDRY